MQRNPYSPPGTTELVPTSNEVVRRPFAVWLLLLVIVALVLVWVTGTVGFLLALQRNPNLTHYHPELWVGVAWRSVVILVVAFAAVGIYRGNSRGRWLGIALIMALMIWNLLRHDDTQYVDGAERLGGLIGRFCISTLLLLWWAHAFGFSAKAKRYFSKGV